MKPIRAIVAVPTCLLLLSACGGGGEPPGAAAPTAVTTVTETVTAEAEAEAAAEATVTVTETVTAAAPTPDTAPSPEPEEEAEETEPEEEAEEAQPEEEAEPAGEASEGQVAFGETWTWEDGTSVTVSEPEAFTPTEFAFGGEGFDHHRQFTISVDNETGESLDLGLFFVTMQSGRSEADEVFDTDNGMEGSPYTTLLDGRSVEFLVGFGVEDPDDMVMELTPSFDYDSAFFTN